MEIRVLTVRQPWAWAIFNAGKDVENRRYPTSLRGALGIHAGQVIDMPAIAELRAAGFDVPDPDDLPRGVIVGVTNVVDCVQDSESRWARPGRFHWLLDASTSLRTHVPHRGRRAIHSIDVDARLLPRA